MSIRMVSRLRILKPLLCGAALLCVISSASIARTRGAVRKVAVIPETAELKGGAGVVDVSRQGMLLIWRWGPPGVLKYFLWDPNRNKTITELSLPKPDYKGLKGFQDIKFENKGSNLVIFSPPFLRLFDVKTNREIRHVVPNRLYLKSSVLHEPSNDLGGPPAAMMAVSPRDGLVAVVFNIHGDIRLYLYDSQLERQLATWTLPRYVQDIAWSHAGDKLAVLFNGRFEGTGPLPTTELDRSRLFNRGLPLRAWGPDVWLVDPRSGKPTLTFYTGSQQAQIAFSPDGKLIYVIQDVFYTYPPGKGVIGVFSALSGNRVRTLTAGPRGVHDYFRVSPDGSMIAANARSPAWHPFWVESEEAWATQIPRVVLLDAHTGKLLFERHESESWGKESFAFSPNSRMLFVSFPESKSTRYSRIEVFSLDGLETGNHP